MPFTSENAADIARFARAQRHGLNRAAFWRALGFPNLARAREAYRQQRLAAKLAQERANDPNPKPRAKKLKLD